VRDAQLRRRVGILAVLSLGTIAILYGPPHFSNASHGASPMLARNVAEVDAALSEAPSPDRETMRIKLYADFAFICCYAGFFVAMRNRGATALGLLAAVSNGIENVAILRILDVDLGHTTQGMIDAIRYAGLAKFALASAALGWLGMMMWRTGNRVTGALFVLAALSGLYGLYNNVALQWLGYVVSVGLVGLAILYFRPYYRNIQAA